MHIFWLDVPCSIHCTFSCMIFYMIELFKLTGGPLSSGHIKLGWVGSGIVRLDQFGKVGLGEVTLNRVASGQIGLALVPLSEAGVLWVPLSDLFRFSPCMCNSPNLLSLCEISTRKRFHVNVKSPRSFVPYKVKYHVVCCKQKGRSCWKKWTCRRPRRDKASVWDCHLLLSSTDLWEDPPA